LRSRGAAKWMQRVDIWLRAADEVPGAVERYRSACSSLSPRHDPELLILESRSPVSTGGGEN